MPSREDALSSDTLQNSFFAAILSSMAAPARAGKEHWLSYAQALKSRTEKDL